MRVTDLFLAIPFLVVRDPDEQPPDTQAWARTVIGDARACGR